jgi:hypothetical protein
VGRKIKDISGQKFGKLTVIDIAGKNYAGAYEWNCQCDCGQPIAVSGVDLRNGTQLSCGCGRWFNGPKDLSGQKFNRLRAINLAGQDNNGVYLWNCVCGCGRAVVVKAPSLLGEKIRHCGCLDKKNDSDLSGQKFSKLIAINIAGKDNNGVYLWNCVCDCGQPAVVSSASLLSGKTRHCGCRIGNLGSDISGHKFGKLTAINIDGRHKNGGILWNCQCDCGQTAVVKRGSLIAEGVASS